MDKKNLLNKILAIAGNVLVWFPILAPILFCVVALIRIRRFLFDYLMPAELFLLVLVGAGLLLWVALHTQSYWKLIAWAFGIALVLLFASQGLAALTGLASGETPASGWRWVLVLGMLIGYDMAVITIGIGGILLLRKLFKPAL
jgi:hypothetical protein